jgi:hypothetical protein
VKARPVVKVNLDTFSTQQLNDDVYLHAPTILSLGNLMHRGLDRHQNRSGLNVVRDLTNVTAELSALSEKNVKHFP